MEQFAKSARLPLLVIAGAIILSFIGARHDILAMTFPDPDDALRLQQVRDLLGGQAWFDVVQHRVNPPVGGLMHWSRLIDLPLAIMIGGLTPLLGQGAAEYVAILIYSVTMLAALTFLMARILRLYGRSELVIAGLVAPFLMSLVGAQFRLMRIDHHSAQMLLGAAAFGFTIAAWRRWTGIAVGALLAIAVSISLEAIIYVPAFGLVFAWPWLRRDQARDQLARFCLSFVLTSVGVMLVTRGPQAPLQSYCDAMSRPYLAATAAAALILLAGTRLPMPAVARWAIAGIAALAAVACLALADAQCLGGPFAELNPYSRKYWYESVLEGLPLWKQGTLALNVVALHIFSIIGIYLGWRNSTETEQRHRWLVTGFLFGWAMCVGVMVMRTNGLAHLYGLAGIAWVGWKSWAYARSIPRTLPRILATAANPILVAALLPVLLPGLRLAPQTTDQPITSGTQASTICSSGADIAGLNRIEPSLLFAAIDIGPMVLVESRHSVIATGHHRNDEAIAKVIKAFLAKPDQAQAIVQSTAASYLAFCPTSTEGDTYITAGRHTLASELVAGHQPRWLTPVPMPKGATLQLYRIVRPVAAPAQ